MRGAFIVTLMLAGCGARTGLEIEPPVPSDAGRDAPSFDVPDAPFDPCLLTPRITLPAPDGATGILLSHDPPASGFLVISTTTGPVPLVEVRRIDGDLRLVGSAEILSRGTAVAVTPRAWLTGGEPGHEVLVDFGEGLPLFLVQLDEDGADERRRSVDVPRGTRALASLPEGIAFGIADEALDRTEWRWIDGMVATSSTPGIAPSAHAIPRFGSAGPPLHAITISGGRALHHDWSGGFAPPVDLGVGFVVERVATSTVGWGAAGRAASGTLRATHGNHFDGRAELALSGEVLTALDVGGVDEQELLLAITRDASGRHTVQVLARGFFAGSWDRVLATDVVSDGSGAAIGFGQTHELVPRLVAAWAADGEIVVQPISCPAFGGP